MSDTDLTPKDAEQIKDILTSASLKCLEMMKVSKFSVGDILVRKGIKNLDDDDNNISTPTPAVELIENSILPRRFKVIFVDDKSNTAFLREIMIDGQLDPEVLHTWDYDNLYGWNEFHYYEVDSYFTDSVIFGESFDLTSFLSDEKERREKIVNMNKSASTPLHTLRQVNEFITSLNSGDTFYFHDSGDKNFYKNSYVTFDFKKARKYTLASRREVREWELRNKPDKLLNSKYVYCLRSANGDLLRSVVLIGQTVYRNKPIDLTQK